MSKEPVNHPLTHKDIVREQFGRTANAYVVSPSHGSQAALSTVIEALSPQPHWTVLDVATGGGHVAKTVAGYVHHVVASDLTPTMLQEARGHIRDAGKIENVSYVIADAEQLPFLDATFDAVTCRIAPHHFPDPERFVREVSRVLKTGGRFLLVDNVVPEDADLADWYNRLEFLRDRSHVRCASVDEWKLWMSSAGLKPVLERVSRKTFEFESWCRRMVTDEAQYEAVVQWILAAPDEAKEFFSVVVSQLSVQSLQGFEWLAACDKTDALA